MILTTSRPVETGGLGKSVSYTARVDGKLFAILSSMYTNIIFALVRELFSNAADSHIAAGRRDTPFKVICPTRFNPTLVVRDYGTSMTKEVVYGVYATAFGSTKDDSNEQTGCMGLGAMVALAVGDSYSLICYLDGVKSTYLVYMQADNVPAISLTHEGPTDEPNGVEVRVAIALDKIPECEKSISRLHFSMASHVPFTVEGISTITPHEPVLQVKGGALFESTPMDDGWNRASFYVRQGGVVYPTREKLGRTFGNYVAVLDVPIGSVDVTPSRDDLMMTDKSAAYLKKAYSTFANEVQLAVAGEINAAANKLQKAIVSNRWSRVVDNITNDSLYVRYAHVPLDAKKRPIGEPDIVLLNKKNEPLNPAMAIFIGQIPHFKIVVKRPSTRRFTKRFSKFASRDSWTFYIDNPTNKQLEALIRRLGLKPKQIISSHKLPDVVVSGGGGGSKPKKPAFKLEAHQFWYPVENNMAILMGQRIGERSDEGKDVARALDTLSTITGIKRADIVRATSSIYPKLDPERRIDSLAYKKFDDWKDAIHSLVVLQVIQGEAVTAYAGQQIWKKLGLPDPCGSSIRDFFQRHSYNRYEAEIRVPATAIGSKAMQKYPALSRYKRFDEATIDAMIAAVP